MSDATNPTNPTSNTATNTATSAATSAMPTREKMRQKKRSAQILGVFAKHNFYSDGFTPYEFRTTLEDLGPTYVKIGQIMSSRNDLLSEEYCQELEKLRSNVKPLPVQTVREVIAQEVGKPVDEIFAEFDDKPLGSASIAQAHYGVLADGTRVVTKVQRPGIAEMMRSDFVMLRKLAATVGGAGNDEPSAIDLPGVVAELERVTNEELDFRVEAANTREFREKCIQNDEDVSCPRIIDELTTERICTMTYVDGYSIADRTRMEAEGHDRLAIAERIAQNYMHQILDAGLYHADPHQGNIMLAGGVPYWIDFGMVGRVGNRDIDTLQDLLLAFIQKDPEALATAALSLGMPATPVDKPRLVEDMDSLIGRYGSIRSLDEIDMGALLTDLMDLAGKHGITIRGEYTMLVRSLITMEGVLAELCPELNLLDLLTKRMVQRAQETFDAQAELMGALDSLTSAGSKTIRLPLMAFDVLQGLIKGQTKVKVQVEGIEELSREVKGVVVNVVMAAFACVGFSGSCRLCSTPIQPQVSGVPLVALIGLVLSSALALFTIRNLMPSKSA